jgi:phytanoyl-CoA hydroxylase
MRFINREIPVEGRDFCDMSGDYSKPLSDFSIVNIMLPRKYHPSLKDNVYEVRPAVFPFSHLLLTIALNGKT